jgi:hypothetical protein
MGQVECREASRDCYFVRAIPELHHSVFAFDVSPLVPQNGRASIEYRRLVDRMFVSTQLEGIRAKPRPKEFPIGVDDRPCIFGSIFHSMNDIENKLLILFREFGRETTTLETTTSLSAHNRIADLASVKPFAANC